MWGTYPEALCKLRGFVSAINKWAKIFALRSAGSSYNVLQAEAVRSLLVKIAIGERDDAIAASPQFGGLPIVDRKAC